MKIQCPYWYNEYQSLQKCRIMKIQKGNKKYNIFITELAQLYQDTNEASLSLLLLENI